MYLHVCITEQSLNAVLEHVFVHTYARFEATAEQFKAPALNKPTISHSLLTHKLSLFEDIHSNTYQEIKRIYNEQCLRYHTKFLRC